MTRKLRIRRAQEQLIRIGYPLTVDGKKGIWTRRAIRDVKRGFAFTKAQCGFKRPPVSSLLDKKTRTMLRYVDQGGGKCSPNFRYVEFRCKGITRGMNGPEDNWIRFHRSLPLMLEEYRKHLGHSVTIVSGCRSDNYNKAIDGASASQHRYNFYGWVTYGCDVLPEVHWTVVRAWGIASGIGYNTSTGNAAHLDRGHKNPMAPRRWFSKSNPQTWTYAR